MLKIYPEKIVHFMLCIAIIFIPYTFLTPLNIGVNFTFFDFFLLITFMLTLLVTPSVKLNHKIVAFYIFVGLFLLMAVLPAFNSSNAGALLITIAQYSFIFFVLFPIFFNSLNMENFKKYLMYMCLIWSIFMVFNLPLLNDEIMFRGDRFHGFYSSPGTLGVMIAIILPFMIQGMLSAKNKLFKLIILFGSVSSIVVLLASGSRAGLAALLVGIPIYLILKYGYSLKQIVVTLIIGLSLAAVVSSVASNFERNAFDRMFDTTDNTEVRIIQTEIVWEQLASNNHYLIGTGLQNSTETMVESGGGYRPHNFFSAYLLETGLIGFTAIVGMMILCLGWGMKLLLQAVFTNTKINGFVAATLSSGFMLLVASQFSTPTVYRGLWVFFAFCLWMSFQKDHFYAEGKKEEKLLEEEYPLNELKKTAN
jgi:O-antigen ligase